MIGNHNHLLGRVDGVDGIKTGYTRASGFNLLTSVHRDGRSLVAVVMGGRTGGGARPDMEQLIADHLAEASTARTATMIAECCAGRSTGAVPGRATAAGPPASGRRACTRRRPDAEPDDAEGDERRRRRRRSGAAGMPPPTSVAARRRARADARARRARRAGSAEPAEPRPRDRSAAAKPAQRRDEDLADGPGANRGSQSRRPARRRARPPNADDDAELRRQRRLDHPDRRHRRPRQGQRAADPRPRAQPSRSPPPSRSPRKCARASDTLYRARFAGLELGVRRTGLPLPQAQAASPASPPTIERTSFRNVVASCSGVCVSHVSPAEHPWPD